jgi:hypothetical protein
MEDEHAWRASFAERHENLSHPAGVAVGAALGDVNARVRLVFERLIDGARRIVLHVGDVRRLRLEPGAARQPADAKGARGETPKDGALGRLDITGGLRAPKLENAPAIDLTATQPAIVPLRAFAFAHREPDPENKLEEALVLTLAAPAGEAPAAGFAIGRWHEEIFTPQLAVRPGRGLVIRGRLRRTQGRLIERPPLPPGAETVPSNEDIQKAWLRTPEGAAARHEIISSFDGKFVVEIKGATIADGKARYRVAVRNDGPGAINELRLNQTWLLSSDSGVTPSWQPLPLPPGQSLRPGESLAPATTFQLDHRATDPRRLGVHAAGLVTHDVPIVAFAEVSL